MCTWLKVVDIQYKLNCKVRAQQGYKTELCPYYCLGVAANMSYRLSHAGLIAVRLLFVYFLARERKKEEPNRSVGLVQPALEPQLKESHI